MAFKLVIKDGETDYRLDSKTGNYKDKTIDDVRTYENLAEALSEFLYAVNDEYNTNKVSLSFNPSKKGKK